jgi:Glycosyl transferase family 2
MRVSICIPTMGRAKMLLQAICSILMQEHQDYEVIIRDDDPEHPINPPLPDNRFKYFVEPHLGIFSGVANATLRHATGEILYLMGSDDLLAPGALYTVNEVFERDRFGGAMWVYGKTISVDSHLRYQGIDGASTTIEELRLKNSIGLPSTFWNQAMWKTAGRFDPRYKWACDYDMWLRFWSIRKPEFIDRELGIFRHHDSHLSTDKRVEVDAEAQTISLRHRMFGDMIYRARNNWNQKQAYGDESPMAHD